MNSIDLCKMAIRNLFKRKLRTFLTVLGVIIGTAAIIVMISLGIGMNRSFDSQVQSLSMLTQITVQPPYDGGSMGVGGGVVMQSSRGGSMRGANNTDNVLDDNMINVFKKMPGVIAVTPVEYADIRVVSGKFETWGQVRGIDPSTMEAFGFKIAEGRLLNEEDSKLCAVFGSSIKENFYNPNQRFWNPHQKQPDIDLMNDKLLLDYTNRWDETTANKKHKPIKLEVIGVLQESYDESSWGIYIPLAEVKKINEQKRKYEQATQNGLHSRTQTNKSSYSYVMIKCGKMKDVQTVMEQIKGLGFEAYSQAEYIQSMQQTSLSLQVLLGAIGAVSLFVAAIGIINTMMMAIYERTREIGIMKVIGAALKDIKRLFLFEAALIGLLGGLFGIGISLLLSYLINSFGISFVEMPQFTPVMGEAKPPDVSVIPVWLCLLSMFFSTIIGILAGYFPARRAMKLSALTAIKTE